MRLLDNITRKLFESSELSRFAWVKLPAGTIIENETHPPIRVKCPGARTKDELVCTINFDTVPMDKWNDFRDYFFVFGEVAEDGFVDVHYRSDEDITIPEGMLVKWEVIIIKNPS